MRTALLALLLATIGACAWINHEYDENWAYACESVKEYGYTCEGLEPPELIRSRLIELLPGVRGLYIPGEKYIYVHPRVKFADDTIVHEMVHYIMYENDPNVDRCESERIAREIAQQRWDEEMQAIYQCNAPEEPELYRA